jgi:hypothetical protein
MTFISGSNRVRQRTYNAKLMRNSKAKLKLVQKQLQKHFRILELNVESNWSSRGFAADNAISKKKSRQGWPVKK